MPGDDASGGVASTGTVVHDGALTSWVRDGTAGSAAFRETARAECRPAPFGRSTSPVFDGYPVRPYGPARDRWRAVGTGARCHHRDVSVRQDNDGREPGVPGSASSATPPGGPSLFRGLLRQTGEPLAAEPVAPASVARPLEVELAERLDSVLGIAERLAESHDHQELFRTIVDETMRALRADSTTIRILRDDRLEVAAWAGHQRRDGRDACRSSAATRAGPGRCCAPAGWSHARTSAACASTATTATTACSSSRGELVAPADPPRPRHRLADGGHVRAARLDRRRRRLHHDARDARRDRAHQRRALRADRGPGRPARRAAGRLGTPEPCRVHRGDRPDRRRGDPPDHRLPQRPGVRARGGRRWSRSRSRASSAPTSRSTSSCCAASSARGSPAGSRSTAKPLLINDANADARGSTIPGTDDVDESMLVVPMRYDEATVGVITLSKLGLHQFDDDDLRLLTILADQAATAIESARLLARTQDLAGELRRLLDMSAELSESLDPRQVANLMAGHLARAMSVDECAISYWDRAGGPGRFARLLPGRAGRDDGAVLRRLGLPGDAAGPRAAGAGHRRRRRSARPTGPRSS